MSGAESPGEAIKTRKFFEERARRADPEWLMRFLDRPGGEPPTPDDELPEGYVAHASAPSPKKLTACSAPSRTSKPRWRAVLDGGLRALSF
jgi:hypothetical protein